MSSTQIKFAGRNYGEISCNREKKKILERVYGDFFNVSVKTDDRTFWSALNLTQMDSKANATFAEKRRGRRRCII